MQYYVPIEQQKVLNTGQTLVIPDQCISMQENMIWCHKVKVRMQPLKSKNIQTTLKHKASVPDYTSMVNIYIESIDEMWDAGSTEKPLKGITAGSRQIRTGNITKV